MADNGSAVQDAPRKRGRPRKAEQGKLIDTDHPKDKELLAAARAAAAARDEWMALGRAMKEKYATVETLMSERKLKTYDHDDVHLKFVESSKLKIKIGQDGEEEDDE